MRRSKCLLSGHSGFVPCSSSPGSESGEISCWPSRSSVSTSFCSEFSIRAHLSGRRLREGDFLQQHLHPGLRDRAAKPMILIGHRAVMTLGEHHMVILWGHRLTMIREGHRMALQIEAEIFAQMSEMLTWLGVVRNDNWKGS